MTSSTTPDVRPKARWWDLDAMPGTPMERGMLRATVGCTTTFVLAIGIVILTVGGVMLHGWARPASMGSGAGQGEGILAGLALIVSPVPGLLAAWKPWLGIGLGLLLLVALAVLHGIAIVAG